MSDFIQDYNFKLITSGDIVKGRIIRIFDDGIIADIGYKSDAFVPKGELSLNPNIDIKKVYKIDDEIMLYIKRMENDDGNILASKVLADRKLSKQKIEVAFKNGDILDGEVVEVVKGGILASIFGVKVFIPASQLDLHYVKDLNKFIGKQIKAKIIEYIPDKKLIASQKLVLELENATKKQYVLEKLNVSDIITGEVKKIVDYGAFIDLDGIDGLLPLSEMSWSRKKKPEDILKIGDKISVYILNIDKENKKITLSLKHITTDPWTKVDEKYKVGDVLKGIITSITTFGIFVEIEPGVEGLIHKTNLQNNINVYKTQEYINIEILLINSKDRKISFKEVTVLDEDVPAIEHKELNVKIGDSLNKIIQCHVKNLDKT